jgi:Tol biopolymer transport system component
VAWLGDGSRLLVTAQEHGTDTFKIWQLSYPAGEAQKLTNDLNSYPNISLTSDFNLLAAVLTEQDSNIWVLPAFDVVRATPITQNRNFARSLSWTPDGKIVYASNASGSLDLYSIDARGGNPNQLTTDSGFEGMPSVSADGRYVVFASDRAGTMHLWRMDIDGGDAKQLTDKTDDEPNLSPDGRWVVYTSCTNKCTLWKVAIDGGQPVQITDKHISGPIVSPDGKQIAGFYFEENVPIKYAIFSFEDGQLIKTFPRALGEGTSLRWTADGRAIVYAITPGWRLKPLGAAR